MTSEEIKETYSMGDILSRYGLKAGRAGFINCPFHKEGTASMKIYRDSYYCFGCGAAGDVFSFVQHMEDMDFKGAFKALGGTYRDGNDYQHRLWLYRMRKRRETAQRRLQRLDAERAQVIREIRQQKLAMASSGVFSDEWCTAVNRLEYLFYRLDYLAGERREAACSH